MEKSKEDCVEFVCEKEDPLKRYQTYHRITFDDTDDTDTTDTKSTAKSDNKPSSSQNEKVPQTKPEDNDPYKGCPIARDALGFYSWNLLHTMAIYYPEKPTEHQKEMMKHFITGFAEFYPCKTCAAHFKTDIKRGNFFHYNNVLLSKYLLDPPKVDNNKELSIWFCNQHNVVNRMLGKPLFDCTYEKLYKRWRKGDESCENSLN